MRESIVIRQGCVNYVGMRAIQEMAVVLALTRERLLKARNILVIKNKNKIKLTQTLINEVNKTKQT